MWFVILAVLLVLSPCRAARADGDSVQQAKAAYESGMRLYKLGKYDEALTRFEHGFLARPDPAFLFNIGQCNRMLGRLDEELRAYRAYLRERPDASNRADVEAFMAGAQSE